MASVKKITMREYNGTDYDTLYPKTIAEQVDGVYNQTEINALLGKKPNPNILDNWYFGNPVNQRGQTSYTGEVYTIDRWIAQWTGDGVTYIEDGCISIYRALYDSHICQRITDDLGGQTVTLSVLGKGNFGIHLVECNSDWSFKLIIASHDATVSDNYTLLTVTGVVPQGCKNLLPDLTSAQGVKSQFKAVKLELGSQQTLAHQDSSGNWVLNEIPDYSQELLKCCMSTADPSDTYANNIRTAKAIGGSKIAKGTYTGTGGKGSGSKNTLTFDFVPKFVIIGTDGSNSSTKMTLLLVSGVGRTVAMNAFNNSQYDISIEWTDTTVNWYLTSTSYDALYQMNQSGVTYHYVGIG